MPCQQASLGQAGPGNHAGGGGGQTLGAPRPQPAPPDDREHRPGDPPAAPAPPAPASALLWVEALRTSECSHPPGAGRLRHRALPLRRVPRLRPLPSGGGGGVPPLRQAGLPRPRARSDPLVAVPPDAHALNSLCRSRSFHSQTWGRGSMAPAASRPRRPLCLAPSGSPSPEKQPGPRPSSAPAMTSRSPGPGGRLQTAPRLLPGPLASPILVWPGGGGALWPLSPRRRGESRQRPRPSLAQVPERGPRPALGGQEGPRVWPQMRVCL